MAARQHWESVTCPDWSRVGGGGAGRPGSSCSQRLMGWDGMRWDGKRLVGKKVQREHHHSLERRSPGEHVWCSGDGAACGVTEAHAAASDASQEKSVYTPHALLRMIGESMTFPKAGELFVLFEQTVTPKHPPEVLELRAFTNATEARGEDLVAGAAHNPMCG